ncbi:MAG: Yip1 family protein [Nanoarchaeota archaeon]
MAETPEIPPVNAQASTVQAEEFGFWDKLKYLFSNASIFFEKIKREKDISNALMLYSIIVVFVLGASYLSGIFLNSMVPYGVGNLYSPLSYSIGGMKEGIFYLVWFFIAIATTFLNSGLISAAVVGFKGKAKYAQTYQAYTYSMIPFIFLSLIPFIGWLSIIFSFIIMSFGISKLHNISRGKAVVACLIPVFLYMLLIGLFVIFLLGLLRGWN